MNLLRGQSDVSAQVPMPVDRVDDTSTVVDVAGETVTWRYVTSSAWASATGQVTGTIVSGKLAFSGVLGSLKIALGSYNDTTITFGASTRFDAKISIPEDVLSSIVFLSPDDQKATLVKYLVTNGQYAIDHRRGILYGKSKAEVANDSLSYSYASSVTGSVAGEVDVDLIKIAGVAVPLDDAAFTPGTTPVLPVGFFADETATDSVNEGDTGAARMTLDRKQITASEGLDDAAFGVTTGYVSAMGGLADETATDSVDEGDIGALRMTLDRRQITASNFKEDTAHTTADYGTGILSKRTDTAASSADTDGDYATVNTDSLGKVWTRPDGGAASGAADNGNPVKIGGVFNTSAPALDSGDRGDVQMDSSANIKQTLATLIAGEDGSNNVLATTKRKLASSSYAPLLFTNFGANATLNVKSTPGNVFSLTCHNLNASSRYLQLHNTATTPAGAAVPLMTFLIPTGAMVVIGSDFFSDEGLNFTTGIAFGFSTTEGTYTAGTAGDQFTQISYI